MSIYLDYNASTPVDPAVVEKMVPHFRDLHGNPSSTHAFGRRAKAAVERARQQVASLIGAEPQEILFLSGGTEANNLAVRGALAVRPGRIVTSLIEHPSISNLVRKLGKEGHEVDIAGVDKNGRVLQEDISKALANGCSIVSIMAANNETGVLQPIVEIAELCRTQGALFHTDAAQALGKIRFSVQNNSADMATMAAHKMGGPIGIGALYIRTGTELTTLLEGGGQETNRRPGTEAVPLAVGFGEACRLTGERLEDDFKRLSELRDRFEQKLLDSIKGCCVNGGDAERLPNTSNISFAGLIGETLMIRLDLEGFAVSTGSACSSGRMEISQTLLAMGLSEELAQGSIRVSIGRETTWENLEKFLATLKFAVREIRSV